MLSKRPISIAVTTAILLSSLLLFAMGCDKGGSSASNPVAPTGTGGIRGSLYQDKNVRLASAGLFENMWFAFAREADALISVSEAHAARYLNHSNSSPSSGILVELLLNGSVVASTTTGPNGKFEFTGLGAGDYVLRFTKGTELLITTTVSVKDGAITEIEGKITLSSSGNIHLVMEIDKHREVDHYYEHETKDNEKNEIEIKGTITSLSPLIVDVGGVSYTVTTDSNTEFEGTLAIGVTVKVEGTLTGTNTILAKEIEVKNYKNAKKDKEDEEDEEDEDEVS